MPAIKMRLPSGIEVEFASAAEAASFVRGIEPPTPRAVHPPLVPPALIQKPLPAQPAQPEQASLWQDGLARFMAHLGKASRQVLETLAAHDGAWRSGEEISAATSIAPKGIGSVLSAIERTAALSQCPNPIERESRAEGAKALRVRMRPESLVVLKSAFAAAPTEEGAA